MVITALEMFRNFLDFFRLLCIYISGKQLSLDKNTTTFSCIYELKDF